MTESGTAQVVSSLSPQPSAGVTSSGTILYLFIYLKETRQPHCLGCLGEKHIYKMEEKRRSWDASRVGAVRRLALKRFQQELKKYILG